MKGPPGLFEIVVARRCDPIVSVPVQPAPAGGQNSVVVPGSRAAFVQSTSAIAFSCSTFCSARKVAVVSPLPVSMPVTAYCKPIATAMRPVVVMNVATSTSMRVNPRSCLRERIVSPAGLIER